MRVTKLRSALLAGALVLVLAVAAGCGGSDGTSEGTGEPFVAEPPAGVKGGLLPTELKLWTYDTQSGAYVEADGDASQPYEPNLRKPAEPITIAYNDGFGGIPFTVAIKDRLEEIGKEYGITITYCDEQFKLEKAISCAEQQVVKKPDFAIESNFQAGAADAVMKIWNEARIPVANIDVWHPNGIFFGANNYESGKLGGVPAGEYAKAEFDCKDVWVLYGENPGEGEVANLRGTGFIDAIQEICGKLPEDRIGRILLDAGTADQAITRTTDWLTANPDAKHIFATSIDDARASGMAKAFVQSERDGYAVGPGCDDIGVSALKDGPLDETRYFGCVAYTPEKYPDYLVTIALDVLEGKPVPQEVHVAHQFLNQDNVTTLYP